MTPRATGKEMLLPPDCFSLELLLLLPLEDSLEESDEARTNNDLTPDTCDSTMALSWIGPGSGIFAASLLLIWDVCWLWYNCRGIVEQRQNPLIPSRNGRPDV